MKQWEYKMYFDCSIERLQDWGNQGWELVSVVNRLTTTWFYFKREKKQTSIQDDI